MTLWKWEGGHLLALGMLSLPFTLLSCTRADTPTVVDPPTAVQPDASSTVTEDGGQATEEDEVGGPTRRGRFVGGCAPGGMPSPPLLGEVQDFRSHLNAYLIVAHVAQGGTLLETNGPRRSSYQYAVLEIREVLVGDAERINPRFRQRIPLVALVGFEEDDMHGHGIPTPMSALCSSVGQDLLLHVNLPLSDDPEIGDGGLPEPLRTQFESTRRPRLIAFGPTSERAAVLQAIQAVQSGTP